MAAFSAALQLTDLDDFIAPGETCIKPVPLPKAAAPASHLAVGADETVYEVTKDGDATAVTETATISLNDCLACSGCVTSAESVLVAQQSHQQVLDFLAASPDVPVVVTVSPQTIASLAASHGIAPAAVARKVTWFCQTYLRAARVLDAAFFRDISLVEAANEFVERYREHTARHPPVVETAAPDEASAEGVAAAGPAPRRRVRGRRAAAADEGVDFSQQRLPMLASACPGWICYAEKTQPFVLPLISSAKSPQQVAGAVVRQAGDLARAYHVAVMPCYDKKLEASRADFYNDVLRARDVDCVLATKELDALFGLLAPPGTRLADFPEAPLDAWFRHDPASGELVGVPGSASGGYLEYLLVYGAQHLLGLDVTDPSVRAAAVTVTPGRNADVVEYTVRHPERGDLPPLKLAAVYGFTNIQNALRRVRSGAATAPAYHYVEIMACPSGCINGGGQLPPPSHATLRREWVAHVEAAYRPDGARLAWPHENAEAMRVRGHVPRDALHTQYHAVAAQQDAGGQVSVKW
ncbi:Cytosolic Fe-S cluster assembly factor nar1 [Blastocladiella emersonii ATCC 22665]|nr:Cytosolic Fe-S cluster assembly factor nar1 [Blastocladiella emersonii ATCC 22665]